MDRKMMTVSSILTGLLLAGASARAAMVWGPATTISGDSDIATTGSLIEAYNVGNTGGGSLLIDGVTFTNSGFSGAGITGATADTANAFGAPYAPFSNLSPNYQQMLSDAAYAVTAGPFTLTLTNLTAGSKYEFEWWVNDARGYDRSTTATDGSSVTLTNSDGTGTGPFNTYGGNGYPGSVGQFAIGTFVAGINGIETISFTGNPGPSLGASAQINGYQLREIPEPSTVMLPCLVGWLLRRRRNKENQQTEEL